MDDLKLEKVGQKIQLPNIKKYLDNDTHILYYGLETIVKSECNP